MPLFFVHIPKTAGTSFRLGAEQSFGKPAIAYDYGKASPETSPLVQEYLYEGEASPDFWAFAQACRQQTTRMVAGHVMVRRFVSVFGASQTLTFMREPLQRMASEYAHFVRNYGYQGSFRDFYSRPLMHNRQSRILHGVDLEAIGFVGFTEHYADSLAMLNARFGTSIALRTDNRGKPSLEAEHAIEPDDETELRQLNASDIVQYRQALALFEARKALFEAGKPWAHARLNEASATRVSGWAWRAEALDEPVQVEVWVNDELAGAVRATELRPALCQLLPPRGGYVGFHLPVKLAPGDRVQCRVADTGQQFPLKPRPVREPEAK